MYSLVGGWSRASLYDIHVAFCSRGLRRGASRALPAMHKNEKCSTMEQASEEGRAEKAYCTDMQENMWARLRDSRPWHARDSRNLAHVFSCISVQAFIYTSVQLQPKLNWNAWMKRRAIYLSKLINMLSGHEGQSTVQITHTQNMCNRLCDSTPNHAN